MTTYDDQNVFAKILRGEIPCFRIYENARTFAFLDIMPRSPGHTLVIPKAPARGILDVPAEDFADVARTAKKIAGAAGKVFDAEGIILQQFSEPASGQVVFHLHMHVIPVRMRDSGHIFRLRCGSRSRNRVALKRQYFSFVCFIYLTDTDRH